VKLILNRKEIKLTKPFARKFRSGCHSSAVWSNGMEV
jgi:hypothetical protein